MIKRDTEAGSWDNRAGHRRYSSYKCCRAERIAKSCSGRDIRLDILAENSTGSKILTFIMEIVRFGNHK